MFSFRFWSSSLKNLAIQSEQQYSNGHGQNANTSSTMFIGNGSTIRSSNENCHLMPGHVSFYCMFNKKKWVHNICKIEVALTKSIWYRLWSKDPTYRPWIMVYLIWLVLGVLIDLLLVLVVVSLKIFKGHGKL